MTLFGLTITRRKQALPASLSGVPGERGWFPIIREPFGGAWQRGITETTPENVLAFSAVYACVTMIAQDIGKLRIKLIRRSGDIWEEGESAAFSPVLRKPNRYQHRIAFLETWMTSKLIHGNTYVIKARDDRGVVNQMYVLDPTRVQPLVAPDGSVFYALQSDALSGLPQGSLAVPASEIIHDMMPALYHPLVGVSPITACGLAAVQGLRAQQNHTDLSSNSSVPSGTLTTPQAIDAETRNQLQRSWQENFTGENYGKVAVLGQGLEYKPMSITAKDAQLIEALKWAGEDVCRAYHVPSYLIGFGPMPPQDTVESMNRRYYSQCLQNPIERIELLLDEGLSLPSDMGIELDLDGLIRMDTPAQVTSATEGILGALFTPNEARRKFDLPPKAGGDTPYLQQQNWSLEALNRRDRQAAQAPDATPAQLPTGAEMARLAEALRKEMGLAAGA